MESEMTGLGVNEVHGRYAIRKASPDRLAAIQQHGGRSVLDVGCGNGTYVLALRDRFEITGVDYKPFDSWQEDPNRFSVSDAASLNLPSASVDTVVSFETLEHLENPEKALKEFHRVCRKNIIITVPNCRVTPGLIKSNLIYSHWNDPTHIQFFELQTITELVESVGFKVTASALINQLNPDAFLNELIGLKGLRGQIMKRLIPKKNWRPYFITCLVVGEKL